MDRVKDKPGLFLNKKIPEVAALISKADLFISNDTGIMHVAGTTNTPQVSVFGPTNPFNWAPIGHNKLFVRKSELIDDVTVQDVYDLCVILLTEKLSEGKKGN
jgi:heptosyltransferase-2